MAKRRERLFVFKTQGMLTLKHAGCTSSQHQLHLLRVYAIDSDCDKFKVETIPNANRAQGNCDFKIISAAAGNSIVFDMPEQSEFAIKVEANNLVDRGGEIYLEFETFCDITF